MIQNFVHRQSGVVRIVILLVVIIFLISCSEDQDHQAHPNSELLYELYLGDPSNVSETVIEYEKSLHQDSQDRIHHCMATLGFEYDPEPPPVKNNLEELTLEEARVSGFGISFNTNPAVATDSTQPEITRSAEYRDALYSNDGCYDQAKALERSFYRVFQQYEEDFGKVWEAYLSHPEVLEAADHWALCMKNAGFSFKQLEDLKKEIGSMIEKAQSSSDIRFVQQYEIAAAVTHLECSIGLTEIYSSVISELSNDFNEKHRAEILLKLKEREQP